MAWYDNLKSALHPYDDDYIENEAAAAEEEFENEPPRREARVYETKTYEEPAPRYEEPKIRRKPQPAPQQAAPMRMRTEFPFVAPKTFEEASKIADDLRNRKTVVMNLEACDPETARRLLDFLSGVAYAIGGKVNRVSTRTYMITPNNVDLVGDAVDDLEASGIYF